MQRKRIFFYLVMMLLLMSFVTSCNINSNGDLRQRQVKKTEPKEVNDLNYQVIEGQPVKDMKLIGQDLWYVTEKSIKSFNIESNEIKVERKVSDINKIFYTKNNIWFAFSSDDDVNPSEISCSLLRYNLITRRFYEYAKNQLLNVNISTIVSDANQVLVGEKSEKGINTIDLKNDSISITDKYGGYVTSIVGNDSYTWFGTLGYGLKEKSAHGIKTFDQNSGLKSDYINQMLLNKYQLWIADSGEGDVSGLSALDLATGKWSHFGFNGEYSSLAGMDEQGSIWVQIDQELKQFIDSSGKWRNYRVMENVVDIGFYKDYAILGTQSGLVKLNKTTGQSTWILKGYQIRKILTKGDDILVSTDKGIIQLKID